MLGTLNGALEARGIRLSPDDITAEVEGINEVRDRIPVLTEVVVHYHLRIPSDAREAVDRALERHAGWCPSARSLEGVVRVRWTADITEVASEAAAGE